MPLNLPIRQNAYIVDDVRAAARKHNETFGSGPFFVVDHMPLAASRYRGKDSPFDHSAAYGQWGNIMIEFMCQHNDDPSAIRDVYPRGKEGFHHVAIIVDSMAAARAEMERRGFEEALYAQMHDGFEFIMFDARATYGHFIELYEGIDRLRRYYDFIADSSRGWDGEDVIRPLDLSAFS